MPTSSASEGRVAPKCREISKPLEEGFVRFSKSTQTFSLFTGMIWLFHFLDVDMQVNLLKKYEQERKPANVTMMAILDGFQKAYSIDFGPFNFLRGAAFNGANYVSPLKRSIISYASGERKFPIFF